MSDQNFVDEARRRREYLNDFYHALDAYYREFDYDPTSAEDNDRQKEKMSEALRDLERRMDSFREQYLQ